MHQYDFAHSKLTQKTVCLSFCNVGDCDHKVQQKLEIGRCLGFLATPACQSRLES